MLHLPGAVSLQFVTSVQSSCEARRGAWSILCFKCIWTLHSQLQLGYFMDPAVISAGILRTRPPGLAQLALLCPAVWLLSPIALTVTQAVVAESRNWVSLCFVSSSVGSVQRTEIGIKRSAVRKIKKPKGCQEVWKTSNVFTSTHVSFFLILWYFKSTVAQKHLKVERLGQSWKHIHWTKFRHEIKVFLPQAVVACSGLISCVGFKLVQPILSQRTFWLPAIKNAID